MACSRLALRIVAHAAVFGVREELIGDLLEEVGGGRSRAWIGLQLVGLYATALHAHLRDRARPTPHAIAIVLTMLLAAAASIAPARIVLIAWLGCYYVAGTLSLFAHMASSASAQSHVELADAPSGRP